MMNTSLQERMAEAGFLSVLVKSLARDDEEQREAVILLSYLSDVPTVVRRLGKVRGCIVMLVSIFHGKDEEAANKAEMLLNAMSNNTQYVLNMAEAGYFKPLIHHLKEGSDMSKILVATALSRMVLNDQCKASLGKHGAIEPLVLMFTKGNLEAKLSALNALHNLSSLKENIKLLISSDIVVPLLQLLFSVTSILVILREPASAILAMIARYEDVLVKPQIVQQMLSLLNLSSPVIQCHLLSALTSIASHASAARVRKKMKENGAIRLLLPLLMDGNSQIRTAVLNLVYALSKDDQEYLAQQLEETHILMICGIISSSDTENERAAAAGVLSNLPTDDKKVTDTLKNVNILPTLVSISSSMPSYPKPSEVWLAESIAAILLRFTVPSDKKLQHFSVNHGVIPALVKLLTFGSVLAKSRAATCLAQLSQNSSSLVKSRKSKWFCTPSSVVGHCEVHDGSCSIKSTFCLIKSNAVPHFIQILEGSEREADEAVLSALATLLDDKIWENGTNFIAKHLGTEVIVKILELGSIKAQEKALWILERLFRVESCRTAAAKAVLIGLAQTGDLELKPGIAKLLAQLELLQDQSSYF
ncbi:OLC1v1001315C2 [Oldenlandia corymbosa var. corymbosa]|uniref:OLC1v1001315C2 n=1 Tax=Oldenlandia corymbosa var. corymbosa TaxID=529605 RepID=A0AAV1D581_OLDCO|nr:OLC1v1001315C2 [Oldenlandia corymbosa var. corymbosa]